MFMTKLSIFKCHSLFLILGFRDVVWRLLSSATFTSVAVEVLNLQNSDLIVYIEMLILMMSEFEMWLPSMPFKAG